VESWVDASLGALGAETIGLEARGASLDAVAGPGVLDVARGLPAGARVVAKLVREREEVETAAEDDYRAPPHVETHEILRCTEIAPFTKKRVWRPEDEDELQWVLAWSARVGAALSLAAVIWALVR
jgi:hypothetical protein